jgi:hypothetical protein
MAAKRPKFRKFLRTTLAQSISSAVCSTTSVKAASWTAAVLVVPEVEVRVVVVEAAAATDSSSVGAVGAADTTLRLVVLSLMTSMNQKSKKQGILRIVIMVLLFLSLCLVQIRWMMSIAYVECRWSLKETQGVDDEGFRLPKCLGCSKDFCLEFRERILMCEALKSFLCPTFTDRISH